MSELYIPILRGRLDPHTLQSLRPAWQLPESRESRYVRLGDSDSTTSRPRDTQPPGEWVERSSTHPTSGRRLHWKERTIGDGGTIERFYLNPAISER